ncbi:hypothetical protein ACFV9E_17965 [Streptomyces sp. NPDC059835]|uniref:hypothetical protein n=1 Tax=Streptomyces sp. NPDC059835 TaxID=3346967 RepID=UPI00365A7845
MKPRTVLGVIALTAMPLLLTTPAQAAAPETPLALNSHSATATPARAADGPLGPGLSALVAIAEGILRKYGITQTYANIADLDAGLQAIAGGILGVNGQEGA